MTHTYPGQVDNLRNELETQSNNRGALEARASEAEKKVQELILKLENVSISKFHAITLCLCHMLGTYLHVAVCVTIFI